jgi:hypothetical protein
MPSIKPTNDNDALHILPLANIPLQVAALRKTRLIKNAKLEGVIEIYGDATTGSGQVTPEGLADVFDFSGERAKDLVIVKTLADLPSYDVYSLRCSLAKANIDVDDVETLKLSDGMVDSLSEQMRTFTRPLVARIYGDDSEEARSLQDIRRLFTDQRAEQALKNLSQLAAQLEIGLPDMAQFLEDYADVYLSLAFYQKCHEDNASGFDAFMRDLEGLARAPSMQAKPAAARQFEVAVETFRNLYFAVGNMLVALRARTTVMWEDISGQRFRRMTELVIGHQQKIGALLCAITVKLDAWRRYATSAATDSATDKANFVNSSMMYGLGALTGLKFEDT